MTEGLLFCFRPHMAEDYGGGAGLAAVLAASVEAGDFQKAKACSEELELQVRGA